MKVDVTARSTEVKESARRLAREKCQKLERFFGGAMSVKVVLDKQRDTSRVEMIAATSAKHTVVIETEHEDLLAAIDVGVEKLERALRKWKEKLTARGRKVKTGFPSGETNEDIEDDGPTYQEVVEGS